MGTPKYLYTRPDQEPPKPKPEPPKTGGGTATSVRPPREADSRHAHAFINSKNDTKPLSSINTVLPYVIIGRGFAATLNLVTLLKSEWGRDRLEGRHVIFIGFPDPWLTYIKHGMNQEVELLTLPGFETRTDAPDPLAPQRWLWSTDFAANTDAEFQLLMGKYEGKISVVEAVVTGIKENKTAGYDITLKDASPIKAGLVDICVGTGQAALLESWESVLDGSLHHEYTEPMKVDGTYTFAEQRRVFAAEMYVRNNVLAATGGGRSVCFHGASPASIQAMEHSLGMDGANDRSTRVEEAFIYATRGGMNEGFLPGGRLDELAKLENGDPLPKRHDTARCGPLRPAVEGIWFGEKLRMIKVEEGKTVPSFLRVTFEYSPGPRLVDINGPVTVGQPYEYITGLYDQVVIGSGRLRDAHAILDSGLRSQFAKVETGQGFPVAMAAKDETIRLMGAAGLSCSLYGLNSDKTLLDFQGSLPCMARVNCEGVTLCAVAIAYANRYFTLKDDTTCNHNANTASQADLKKLVGDRLAEKIQSARICRIAPFKNYDHLVNALERYMTKEANDKALIKEPKDYQGWDVFIDNFNTDQSLLDPVRFGVWKRDISPWVALESGEKEALKKLTFSYGEAGNETSPDAREYPISL